MANSCECCSEPSSYIKCVGISGLAEELSASPEGLLLHGGKS